MEHATSALLRWKAQHLSTSQDKASREYADMLKTKAEAIDRHLQGGEQNGGEK